MKVVVCNTDENKGGAAKAARRISKSLLLNGIEAPFFALESDEKRCESFFFRKGKFFWSRLEQFPKFFYSNDFAAPFSTSKYSLGHKKYIDILNPDIISLHYVNCGLFSIKDIGNFKKPVVWTLHDSWAFTGGCHLPLDCQRYKDMCGNCPVLNVKKEKDLSRSIWKAKEKFWRDANLTIVSPSKWLAKCAKESSLFKDCRVETISNPLDTKIFKRHDKALARKELGLKKEKKYILFGAVNATKDKNKGFVFLQEALKKVKMKNVELLIFGSKENIAPEVSIPVQDLGFVEREEDLAKIYSASDITVIPSISENQPNIAVESLSCGTPVVGFDINGLKEMIVSKKLGLLAKKYESEELAQKIEKILSEKTDSVFCSNYIEKNFNPLKIGKKYKELFEDII